MSITYQYCVVLVIALSTFLFRFAPFVFKKQLEQYSGIKYLERYLPASIMFILVIYTLKDISFSQPLYGSREIISVICVIWLHLMYRNVLLSIGFSTTFYVVLKAVY